MFKFNFGDNDEGQKIEQTNSLESSLLEPGFLTFDTLKSRAPRISYTFDKEGLPRRDLFDVKYELMSADNLTEEEQLLLGTEDVRKNVYEGGLKVWEGAYDLLEAVKNSNQTKTSRIMELGCGAGIPISYLFYQMIKSSWSGELVLADYNTAVLSRLTMPNIVLSWLHATESPLVSEPHNELTIDAQIVSDMEADLAKRGITLQFVYGAWGPSFSELVGNSFDLILASETIYSLDSITAFTDVVKAALENGHGTALIAAKKIYFGVGGGVVEFERLLDERKMSHNIILEKGSLGRVVLEVKHS